jgi:hypothetical protein
MPIDILAELSLLVQSAEFVHLSRVIDEDESARIFLSFRRGNQSFRASGLSLEEAMLRFVGEPGKRCSRCKAYKPLTEYPRAPVRADRPEGRHSHCRVCDRARKRGKYLRSSRRGVNAGIPPAPAVAAAAQSPPGS